MSEARKRAAEKGWLGQPQEPVEWQLNAFLRSNFLAEQAARREAEGQAPVSARWASGPLRR